MFNCQIGGTQDLINKVTIPPYHEMFLATVDISRVHSVLPADLSVGHTNLLSIVGDRNSKSIKLLSLIKIFFENPVQPEDKKHIISHESLNCLSIYEILAQMIHSELYNQIPNC